MIRRPVTASLLHRLVAAAHAEGCTRLAVAALIEDHDHVLLVDTGHCWELPADLVLPGEALDDAVCRTASGVGIALDHRSGYLGHHDRIARGDVVRTFVFAATARHPDRAGLPSPRHPHQWAPVDDLPDDLDDGLLRFVSAPAVNACACGPPVRLPAALLRAHVRGLPAAEAAIELLISHHSWLHRNDFIDGYIDLDDHIDTALGIRNATQTACVNWAAAITALDTRALPCSSGESRLLRIAASLAEGIPVDLGDTLTGLDNDNLDLVIQAVLSIRLQD